MLALNEFPWKVIEVGIDRVAEREGYLVVKGVVPAETCDAVTAMLYSYLGLDPHKSDDWSMGSQ